MTHSIVTTQTIMRAPLSQFRSTTPHVLFGQKLTEVKAMARSIQRHGLLSPLLVSRHNGRLIVIDGRLRLAALRRLRFQKALPRDLETIPYVLNAAAAAPVISLLSARDLYSHVTTLKSKGLSIAAIAQTLFLPGQTISDVLSVSRLSPVLKQAFFNERLSLDQVKAFAALPHHDAQDRLLQILGPFATVDRIMSAIADGIAQGCAVIDLGGDNVVIMPSRTQDALKIAA
ncbi:ParB/RepB/Spo0J family partition protein [Fretibacter rubidus]|uniref:ParB/RepB/Spo0J family partition protein n=1 Tax=Fretibacter rubidus TaxID=570162 RepID=UPI00352B4BDA